MRIDAIELEIFKNLFHSISEEMGASLRRTAFSPNIKERRDYSCALFDAAGNVIAMGDHMPVHLGSMPMSVKAALNAFKLERGDVAMLNDPFAGGTHLPDITVVAPVFIGKEKKPSFFVSSRAHHADVGGMYPGSMGPCREIYQEGLRIPPIKIVRGGVLQQDVLSLLLANVRTPQEREGDLRAQLAACHTGEQRLQELCKRYGVARMSAAASELLTYSERLMRAFLAKAPEGTWRAEDLLDDDGVNDRPVKIAVQVCSSPKSRGKMMSVDFSGSDPQVEGAVNAVAAITYSACFYVFRCLLEEDVPATAGLMRPIEVFAPEGTVVNAKIPAAVAGGNVETSQRIVDVLLRALAQAFPNRVPAAAAGTMTNVTIGGIDPRTGEPFSYYETIAGGMGARPGKNGVSGVHTHMTNSLNTPAEALEYAYPFRVTRYSLRRGSGGEGEFRGGDGIVREIELLCDAQVSLLSDRRKRGPYGLDGGDDGGHGNAFAVTQDNSIEISAKGSSRLKKNSRLRLETPGGGGWGMKEK